MGYNGSIPKSTIMHPNLKNYLYIAGSVIVIAEMNDANAQEFLRGHDDEVTCIALSNSGGLLASGQKGKNSDVFIWNFEARKVLFRLSEHDYLIQNLQFSQDDRLLYSSGNIDDKKMYIWDTQTGYIVANCPTYPTLTSAVAWGNRVKDNKGQSTENYQLATCGGLIVSLWSLDPFKGVLSSQAIQTGNFTREYISLAFSLNEEKFLYAGTTSGDIVCFLVKTKMIVFSKIVCSRGVTSIIPIAVNQFVVGGGDGSMSLLYIEEPKCEILTTISLFGSIYSLSPSPDGIQLLASTDKGFIYRVRTADLSYILLNENHTDGIISYFNPAELQGSFGTASLDRTIRLWDLEDYSSYYRLFLNLDLIPTCLEFTDDVLFSGWSDGKLRTFEIKNSKCKVF